MRKIGTITVGAALSVCALTGAAQAAARTFVSGKGADSGACSLAAPCRSFAYAATQTNDGGELVVLDTAGYGGLTITKSISIVNDGAGVASVQVPSGSAITINAPSSAVIHLRGLTLEGANTATDGIVFNTGGSLTVLNTLVRHFVGNGIYIQPNNVNMAFNILGVNTLDNGGRGIWVAPFNGGSAHGIVDRVTASGNFYGIVVDSVGSGLPNTVSVSNSIISLNQFGLFSSAGNNVAQSNVFLRDSVVAQNAQTGVGANGSNAILQLSGTTITANFNGVITQGTVESFGNNQIHRNLIDLPTGNGNSGTLTQVSQR